MRTATALSVPEVESTEHEALPLDPAERAAIRCRISTMVWAGERTAIRTRIGSIIWSRTTVDEATAGDLADRILEFVETRLPVQDDRER
jgi:hypothetical protein